MRMGPWVFFLTIGTKSRKSSPGEDWRALGLAGGGIRFWQALRSSIAGFEDRSLDSPGNCGGKTSYRGFVRQIKGDRLNCRCGDCFFSMLPQSAGLCTGAGFRGLPKFASGQFIEVGRRFGGAVARVQLSGRIARLVAVASSRLATDENRALALGQILFGKMSAWGAG